MCSGSVIAGIRLYRENVRLNVYPGKRTVITTPLLEDLLNTMQAWEKELAALFSYLASANELPKGPLYYCNLLILAVYMQYYTVAGTTPHLTPLLISTETLLTTTPRINRRF